VPADIPLFNKRADKGNHVCKTWVQKNKAIVLFLTSQISCDRVFTEWLRSQRFR
jgi:hypothetical protein